MSRLVTAYRLDETVSSDRLFNSRESITSLIVKVSVWECSSCGLRYYTEDGADGCCKGKRVYSSSDL